MQCDELEELAGAYALGALPEEEREQVRSHLRSCPHAHRSLQELAQVAALLPFTAPEAEPPPHLGPRILAQVRAEASSAQSHAAGSPRGAPRLFPLRRLPGRELLGWAAALLLALGLGAWGLAQHNAALRERANRQQDERILAAVAAGSRMFRLPGSHGLQDAILVQPRDDSPAYLLVNWPRPDGGKSYEAWYISGGQAVSAAVFDGSHDGPQVIRLNGPVKGVQSVAVTVEKHGGSATPSLPALAQRVIS